ncbi:sensor histidine kinase [Fusibacter sp. JL298sf-3]
MKKIFHKFAFIYMVIFIISFILIIIGVRSVLDYYFISNETELIVKRVSNYERTINLRFENLSLNALQEQIVLLDGYTGADIWLFSDNGQVYSTDESTEVFNIDDQPFLVDDLKRVFNQDIVTREVHQSADRIKRLRVGYPFRLGEKYYAMFINVPMPELEDTISRVSVIVFISLSISGFLAVSLIFLITKQMGHELEVINDAAKYIAQGNFDKKIIINRRDELGDLAQSFNAMADELHEQEKTKRMFISSLSHDLRTPLTNIKGYTRGMLDGTIEPDKNERYLKIVLSESERLIKMINDLLDLSKMEGGSLVLNRTDFELNEMILNVLDSFEQTIVEKEVRLTLDLSHDNVMAHGDYASIHRVVFNLLDNATKFVDVGGDISIRTELKEDKYYVGISNSGRTLSEKELQIIWDRFTKLDASRGLEKKSSGLGLAIVKEIIKAHGEEIDVYSNDDIGVAFIFTVSTQIFKNRRKDEEEL